MIRLLNIILILCSIPLIIYSQCECEYGVAYEPSPGLCYVINACSDELASNYCPGDAYFNENCIYDNEEVLGCTCSIAYNYNPSATVDDGNCIIIGGCSDPDSSNYSNCGSVFYNENCIYGGCTDFNACNYNSSVNQDDGSCEYPELYYNCDGVCLNDSDGDGICDENEFSGCADPMAENYFCQSSNECGFDFSTGFPIFILPEGFNDNGSCEYDGIDDNGDGLPDNSLQGCEDPGALNYNSNFSVWSPLSYINNFSDFQLQICIYPVYGCIDFDACNYDITANSSDGTCTYPIETYLDCNDVCLNDIDSDGVCDEIEVNGCTDANAYNYNIFATDDDDSCIFPVYGCTSQESLNYDPDATEDDGSCIQEIIGCMNELACNYDINVNSNNEELCIYSPNGYDCDGNCLDDVDLDGVCDQFEISGCTDSIASNYNPEATDSDNNLCEYITECSCEYGTIMQVGESCFIINACSDPESNNYCEGDQYFNEYCEYDEVSFGCMCEEAVNYNPNVTEDDGSCIIVGGCNDVQANNYTNCEGTYYNEVCLYYGCIDVIACNYNDEANYNDGSCEYPEEYLDCEGNCLNDINENGICDQIEGSSVQTISLEQGWNIFSSNLLIENPNVTDVMSPVSTSLLVVKDDVGNIYWPMVGINQIQEFELGKAYMSKMTFDIDLDIFGSSIEPENIVLDLEEGWGFLGYLRENPMDVLEVVANDYVDIRNNLIIMKDGFGNVLWPDYELNTIQTMYPGQGYLIKMSSDTEFSFLPNNYEYYHLPLVWPDSDNPLDLQTTGGNATMMINLEPNDILLDASSIENGDKIGVFYEGENKWLCAGFLIWDETMPPAALTIWGNIEDGFGLMEGDELKMFIQDSSTGNNYSVENTWNNQGYFVSGDLGYLNNALYQTLSMTTSIYVEGFNAPRFGSEVILDSKFKDDFKKSGLNMVIAIPDYAWGFSPQNSSELLAFDSHGKLVGSSVYNGESISLVVWEDDIFTDEKDGMLVNEKINLKYWQEDLNFPKNLDLTWELGDENYVSNGLAAIGSLNLVDDIIENNLFELFPNPCKDLTTVSFYLSFEKFVEIKIFDLRGNEISTLVSNYVLKGQKELDFDFSFLSSGTYIISIKTKDFQKDILFSKM